MTHVYAVCYAMQCTPMTHSTAVLLAMQALHTVMQAYAREWNAKLLPIDCQSLASCMLKPYVSGSYLRAVVHMLCQLQANLDCPVVLHLKGVEALSAFLKDDQDSQVCGMAM
jgi:hypothetical protein